MRVRANGKPLRLTADRREVGSIPTTSRRRTSHPLEIRDREQRPTQTRSLSFSWISFVFVRIARRTIRQPAPSFLCGMGGSVGSVGSVTTGIVAGHASRATLLVRSIISDSSIMLRIARIGSTSTSLRLRVPIAAACSIHGRCSSIISMETRERTSRAWSIVRPRYLDS